MELKNKQEHMKQSFFITLLTLLSIHASAQYYHVSHLGHLYEGENRMSDEQIRMLLTDVSGLDMSKDWIYARNGYVAGRIFQYGGRLCAAGCLIGLYYADGKGFSSLAHPEQGIGKKSFGLLLGTCAGVLSAVVGETMVSDSLDEMKMIGRWLNESDADKTPAQISFGPTSSGNIGLRLTF